MNSLSFRISKGLLGPLIKQEIHTSAILERARRMTREKKRKQAVANKKAKEARIAKMDISPWEQHLRDKGYWTEPKPIRELDAELKFPVDNVYFIEKHAYKRYTLEEAIVNLKQICHPSMKNDPDAMVHVKIELDMRSTKKDRYLDAFTKMIPIVKAYDRNVPDRQVMCFVPNEEMRLEVLQAGAVMAGGADLIMEVAKGRIDIAEVDHFLCHDELAGQIRPLSAALRDKAPNNTNGTIGVDMVRMIQTFAKGMYVNVKKVAPSAGIKDEPDYGFCTATIGRLNMSVEDMNENLTVILDALNTNAPRRKDKSGFITRVQAYVLPNGVMTAPKAYHFSVLHPAIYDTRVEEQEKVIQEGMEEIAKNVEKLKSN
eukprot:08904.XXX_29256_32054_1 [CDS] Oithona nana genome sequencing.